MNFPIYLNRRVFVMLFQCGSFVVVLLRFSMPVVSYVAFVVSLLVPHLSFFGAFKRLAFLEYHHIYFNYNESLSVDLSRKMRLWTRQLKLE